MASMFQGCDSLSSIDISNFDTSRVTTMANLFNGCNSLSSINLSNFDTYNVNDMGQMFYGCNSLIYIDLSNFNMINCYSYHGFFSNINNIRYINLFNFKNDIIIGDSFYGSGNIHFVCQSEQIINTQNSFNCCNYNFDYDECNDPIIPDTSDSSNGEIISLINDVNKSNKSSGVSIGIIIGIIIVGIVIIGGIIAIIIFCKIKNNEEDLSSTVIQIIQANKLNPLIQEVVYEYETKNEGKIQKIHIVFKTTTGRETKILIDPNKSVKILIKFYLKVVKKPELLSDPDIRYFKNAEKILLKSKDPIKKYINNENGPHIIMVTDIYKTQINSFKLRVI